MHNLHRISEDEVSAALTLLAASSGTTRTADSWTHDHMTALALGERGAPTALMPLSRRTITTAPGKELCVGWLSRNQFASRMSLRRQTRHTTPDWPALLPDTEALLVVRRDEPSLAARWYAQTGFHDVLSIRCLYFEMESPPPSSPRGSGSSSARCYHVQVISPDTGEPSANSWDAAHWQTQMQSVHRDVYGSCGGVPLRSANFWSPALAHHYYRDHYQFQIIGLWNASPTSNPSFSGNQATEPTLMGYAIVGWSGWHSKRPRMDILELATRHWDTAVADDLIRTTCQLAWSKNMRQNRAVISIHDPYRGHLTRTGFIDRWGYLMLAKWLHPQGYLDRLAATLPAEIGNLSLQFSTPGEMPLSLRPPAVSATSTLALQADARTLTRLLLSRLDITAALRDGSLLSATPLSDAEQARLSLTFPWTPWIFHLLDYI